MTIPGQAGLDNSPWITDLGENSLFKFDLASKGWKCYDIPEPKAHPKHVRVAKDGTVWFWMVARNKLGRFRKRGVHVHRRPERKPQRPARRSGSEPVVHDVRP